MSKEYIPKCAMFIYAHPDDIEFGVAGTAAKWAQGGCEVIYVVITDGNVGSHEDDMTGEKLAQTRRAEQTAAGKVAGVNTCIYLGYHDGLLTPSLELRKELVRLIRVHKPNVVVSGDPRRFFPGGTRMNHPDHRAAATAVMDAVFPAAEMNLLYPDFYEQGLLGHKPNHFFVSHADDSNYFVDISDTIDLKIEALRQHVSQLGEWDPEKPLKEWSASIGKKVGFDHAEQFLKITLKEEEE